MVSVTLQLPQSSGQQLALGKPLCILYILKAQVLNLTDSMKKFVSNEGVCTMYL